MNGYIIWRELSINEPELKSSDNKCAAQNPESGKDNE